MEPYRRNLELHTIHAWRFSRASVGPCHGRISTWRLSGCAAEASVERNESFGVSTHNRWQHETWSGDCTDPSPEARALVCLRRFSFLRPLCASQGSLLFQTSAYSSASPGAACPKCPPLRTDQKKKRPGHPPLGGRGGGVLRKVLKSGLDFAPV